MSEYTRLPSDLEEEVMSVSEPCIDNPDSYADSSERAKHLARIEELEELKSEEFINEIYARHNDDSQRLIKICDQHQAKIKELESCMTTPRIEDRDEITRLNAVLDSVESYMEDDEEFIENLRKDRNRGESDEH
jgi:DNA-directed RNA polymerase subunit F